MNKSSRVFTAALGAAAVLFSMHAAAQQPATSPQTQSTDPTRPRNPAANLPSDTGSQTTNPSGAVTGAGQPQGTGRQPDVGSAGGLERRARAQERAAGAAGAGGASAGAATGAGASDGAERPQTRSRARRASKG